MTAHQRHISTPVDPVKLDRLAEVAVKVGLQLQEGQDLLVTAPTVALPLVRRIAEQAYKVGAGLYKPIFSDEAITLSRYRFGHDGSFDRAANWLYDGMSKAFAANTARLAIVGDDPMLLASEDPTKVARWAAGPIRLPTSRRWSASSPSTSTGISSPIQVHHGPRESFPDDWGGCRCSQTGGRHLRRLACRQRRALSRRGKT